MTTNTLNQWPYQLLRLVTLLTVLPSLVTYAHLRYNLSRSEICQVGPVGPVATAAAASSPTTARVGGTIRTKHAAVAAAGDDAEGGGGGGGGVDTAFDPSLLFGMYRPIPAPPGYSGPRAFRLVHRPRGGSGSGPWSSWLAKLGRIGWPSASAASGELATPTSDLLRRQRWRNGAKDDGSSLGYVIAYSDAYGWCFRRGDGEAITKGGGLEVCYPFGSSGGDGPYPPSGTWTGATSTTAATAGNSIDRPSQSQRSAQQSVPANAISLRVSCPGPATAAAAAATPQRNNSSPSTAQAGGGGGSLMAKVRRNPNKISSRRTRNQTLQQILNRPSTTLLLALNLYLAYAYWNARVPPSSVAKIYARIVHEPFELWRTFTGATAHFDLLHIGFNMMSLYALGMELEEGYGSINFLWYNVSLVVLTTAVMMWFTWLRIQHDNTGDSSNLAEQSTVGYSGVLFAWMVVTSLERPTGTCPVPFLPDLCFETYSAFNGRVKFNASPFVQLVVAQFIMPRVSFVGHLAGILCGFALHWNLLPLEPLACPQVLIPGAFLAHLALVRGVVTVRGVVVGLGLGCGGGGDLDDEEGDFVGLVPLRADEERGEGGSNGSSSRSRSSRARRAAEHGRKRYRNLVWARNGMAAAAVVSVAFLDPIGSMVLSQAVSLAFFALGVRSCAVVLRLRDVAASDGGSGGGAREEQLEKVRGGTLWRGAVLALVLLVVTDSMALASWIVADVYISSDRLLAVGLGPAAFGLLCRTTTNLVGLILAVGALNDSAEVGGGVFAIVFGWVLRWAKAAGDGILTIASSKPFHAAFEGRGNMLGGGGRLSASGVHTSQRNV